MHENAAIFVAGHRGLVGSALVRALRRKGYRRLIVSSHADLDLRRQSSVERFFAKERPEYVFLAAARVGGIGANSTYPAWFIYDNLAIELNVVHAAFRHGVKKLQFLGSSCVYPKYASQPISEDELLSGPLEPTNEWYAVAKIAGIKLLQAYRRQYGFNGISVMPTNLYGPGDNFNLQNSHVIPALLRKFHEARIRGDRQVSLWGTGGPRREFLHVDDFASAALHLMLNSKDLELINVGSGQEITIADLARLIRNIVRFQGDIVFDPSKPDGTPRKLLDVSRLAAMGWHPTISLEDGIRDTYRWYVENLFAIPA